MGLYGVCMCVCLYVGWVELWDRGLLWRTEYNASQACVGELVPDVNIFSLGLEYILLFHCLSVFQPKLLDSYSCVAHCCYMLTLLQGHCFRHVYW